MVNLIAGHEARWGHLENGTEYTMIRDFSAPSTSVVLRVRASSDRDPPDVIGLSKFVAFAILRGSGSYPGLNDFYEFVSSERMDFDLRFFRSCVDFFCTTNFDGLNEVLKRFSDAMAVPLLPDGYLEYVEKELDWRLHRASKSAGLQISSVVKDLQGFSPSDTYAITKLPDIERRARDFIARYYTPSNAHLILVIKNSISFDRVEAMIKKNFNDVFDQSYKVARAPMTRLRSSGSVYRWYHSLQARLSRSSDKLATIQSHPSLRGKPTVSFEDACGIKAPQSGWGRGHRIGDHDAMHDTVAGDVVTLVPALIDSPNQILYLTFPTPKSSLDTPAPRIWQYILGNDCAGSICHSLRSEKLIDSLDADEADFGFGKHMLVLSVSLTKSGFSQSELVLRKILNFLALMRRTLSVTEDLQKRAIAWEDIELYHTLTSDEERFGSSHSAWADAVYMLKDTEAVYDGHHWTYPSEDIETDVRYLGEYLCPSNCVAILASSSFYHLPTLRPDAPALRYKVAHICVKHFPEAIDNNGSGDSVLPMPTFDLISSSDTPSRRAGFVKIHSSPFSAQQWYPWKFVTAKFALPLSTTVFSNTDVLGLTLAEYLNSRLWPLIGKRLNGSASYADRVLTVSLSCSPDDLMIFARLIFDIVVDRTSPRAKSAFTDACDTISTKLLAEAVEDLAPRFSVGFEESIGSRNLVQELRELNGMGLDRLPYISSGYFAMLIVGNVRHAHTEDVTKLVGQLMGNDASTLYSRLVPEEIPVETYNTSLHRSLKEQSMDGCGILRSFDLGASTPGSLCLATALAGHASEVLEKELKVGQMYASHTCVKSVIKRGHVWLVIEVIGFREIRYVEPKVNRTIFVSMKEAFAKISEFDMIEARRIVRKRFFNPRKTVDAELDRLWEPIVSEGVSYDSNMLTWVNSLQGYVVAELFRRCVATRETRKCVRVSYTNRTVEDCQPSHDEDMHSVERIRDHPDSDDESAYTRMVSLRESLEDVPFQDRQDSADVGSPEYDSGYYSSVGEESEGQLSGEN